MKILGLTGGSGTGKSAACTAFEQLGCGVIVIPVNRCWKKYALYLMMHFLQMGN